VAVYIPQSRRRRRAALLAGALFVVGAGLGWGIGHAQAPSVSDQVATVRRTGDRLAGRLSALPIEYRKAVGGDASLMTQSVLMPLDNIRTSALTTLDKAPWVAQAQRDEVTNALAAIRTAADGHKAPTEFDAAVAAAAAAIDTVLGITKGP
jgi:hypothetical protein